MEASQVDIRTSAAAETPGSRFSILKHFISATSVSHFALSHLCFQAKLLMATRVDAFVMVLVGIRCHAEAMFRLHLHAPGLRTRVSIRYRHRMLALRRLST